MLGVLNGSGNKQPHPPLVSLRGSKQMCYVFIEPSVDKIVVVPLGFPSDQLQQCSKHTIKKPTHKQQTTWHPKDGMVAMLIHLPRLVMVTDMSGHLKDNHVSFIAPCSVRTQFSTQFSTQLPIFSTQLGLNPFLALHPTTRPKKPRRLRSHRRTADRIDRLLHGGDAGREALRLLRFGALRFSTGGGAVGRPPEKEPVGSFSGVLVFVLGTVGPLLRQPEAQSHQVG